jgi:hypothetical protein
MVPHPPQAPRQRRHRARSHRHDPPLDRRRHYQHREPALAACARCWRHFPPLLRLLRRAPLDTWARPAVCAPGAPACRRRRPIRVRRWTGAPVQRARGAYGAGPPARHEHMRRAGHARRGELDGPKRAQGAPCGAARGEASSVGRLGEAQEQSAAELVPPGTYDPVILCFCRYRGRGSCSWRERCSVLWKESSKCTIYYNNLLCCDSSCSYGDSWCCLSWSYLSVVCVYILHTIQCCPSGVSPLRLDIFVCNMY